MRPDGQGPTVCRGGVTPGARGQGHLERGLGAGPVGHIALGQGALERPRLPWTPGLVLARQQAEPPSLTAFLLDALGELGTASGRPDEAREWLVRSLEVRYDGGERNGMADTLDRLAALAASCAQPERALHLTRAADALYAELGARRFPAEQQKLEALASAASRSVRRAGR